jgi:small-conductance mechanosensitive channel
MMDAFKDIWQYGSYPLFEVSGNKISLLSLLLSVVVFFLALKLANMSERFMNKVLADKQIDQGVKGSIERMTRYIVLVVGILITLDTVGVSIKSLAALGAVLMVGVGFGLQNIAQNFISGLIILFERPIKIGDLVSVGGVSGKVIKIGARATLIHTRDDVAIIVPNSQFISEQVINESFSGEKMRLHLKVGVSYGSDTKKVKECLVKVAAEHSKVLNYPEAAIFFEDFGDSSLQFTLRVWVSDIWGNDQTLSDLRFAIDEEFKAQNIEIPFPQRDLHIRSSVLQQ